MDKALEPVWVAAVSSRTRKTAVKKNKRERTKKPDARRTYALNGPKYANGQSSIVAFRAPANEPSVERSNDRPPLDSGPDALEREKRSLKEFLRRRRRAK